MQKWLFYTNVKKLRFGQIYPEKGKYPVLTDISKSFVLCFSYNSREEFFPWFKCETLSAQTYYNKHIILGYMVFNEI